LKPLQGKVTGLKHRYQTSIFSRTWWNIILFHTFFVFVMIGVFSVTLHYTKLTLVVTFQELLSTILSGGVVDPDLIADTSEKLNRNASLVYIGIFVFAVITSALAAHITLGPTRKAFTQQKQFIGTIAHELRTPLAILRTQNEVALYEHEPGSETHELLKENIEQTRHLTNILNNLLVFNRIDTTESIQFDSVDLGPVVEGVLKRLEGLAHKRRVVLRTDLAPIPNVYANQSAIEQAIYNLTKNAILYSDSTGGTVTVSVTHDNGSCAILRVTDTGVGIPQDKLPHIFEPFYRVSEDDRGTKGTGLGLALVFEIVKLHNGMISALHALFIE
jgi:signal transduction histidine kinase